MSKDNKLIILTTLYNCSDWIAKCVDSIKSQNYENFECYILDDMSTDTSIEEATKSIKGDPRFTIIQNDKKYWQVGNYDQVIRSSKVLDDDIIVEVDGDDWLPDDDVFDRVVAAYLDGKTWLTFGQFRYVGGEIGHCRPSKVEGCRSAIFTMSHLRTWKAFLWRHIKQEDLYYPGDWYVESAGDMYYMIPMFEMATESHTKFLEEVNYVYNNQNPLNDDKRDRTKQVQCDFHLRSKYPYKKLNGRRS